MTMNASCPLTGSIRGPWIDSSKTRCTIAPNRSGFADRARGGQALFSEDAAGRPNQVNASPESQNESSTGGTTAVQASQSMGTMSSAKNLPPCSSTRAMAVVDFPAPQSPTSTMAPTGRATADACNERLPARYRRQARRLVALNLSIIAASVPAAAMNVPVLADGDPKNLPIPRHSTTTWAPARPMRTPSRSAEGSQSILASRWLMALQLQDWMSWRTIG